MKTAISHLIKTNILVAVVLLTACNHSEKSSNNLTFEEEPTVKDAGKWVEFPKKSEKIKLFETVQINNTSTMLEINAPANVIGKVHKSTREKSKSIIIFDTPELTSIYSAYLQNITLLITAKKNFDRVNDLYKNGAVTGKELNESSTELMNIQTSLVENEAKLREFGLNPENLNNSPYGTTWLICDFPESELNLIKKNDKLNIEFPSFPNEIFNAKIDVITDVMNTQSRKIRLRLSLIDNEDKILPGMYAKVKFEKSHKGLMIPKKAVFTANAKYYIFIKHTENIFERREVSISTESGDYIEISEGLTQNEIIVISNVYLLKGLSIGI